MGRKKKYLTEEEKLEAKRKWKMDYYWRNKEILQKKNLDRYHKNKNEKDRRYFIKTSFIKCRDTSIY